MVMVTFLQQLKTLIVIALIMMVSFIFGF